MGSRLSLIYPPDLFPTFNTNFYQHQKGDDFVSIQTRLTNLEKKIRPGVPPDRVIFLDKSNPDYERKLQEAQQLREHNPRIVIICDDIQ